MTSTGRQLFLSKRIVTETEVTDGGVLVNENGLIEKLLDREQAEQLIKESNGDVTVVDGGELAMMPGVVDSHVHVNEPGRTAWEGFRTATSAAAAGGITTIVDMPLNSIPPTTTLENFKIKVSSAKGNVFVDVGFWGGVIVGNEDSLCDLVEAGVVGFKCFLCPSGVDEFPNVQAEDLEKAFAALEGTGSLLAFHAEMEDDKNECDKKILKKDPEEYTTYLESRPPKMELNAISLISSFLNKTDVRVHVVHVSSASVVPLLNKAREERLASGNKAWRGGVTAETCHHYLSLSAEQIPRGRSEYKCAPPIRDTDNKEKLWKYLLEDKLDMVVSDHSPCTPELKCSNNLEAWGGISSVQFDCKSSLLDKNIFRCREANALTDGMTTVLRLALFTLLPDVGVHHRVLKNIFRHDPSPLTIPTGRIGVVDILTSPPQGLSLFWTEASARGLDLTSICKYMCAAPAQLCGIQDHKGAIKPGLDADLIFFDPDAEFTVTTDIIRHKNKLTPYIGKTLKGVVKKTYLRGQLIYADGDIIEKPKGNLLLKAFNI